MDYSLLIGIHDEKMSLMNTNLSEDEQAFVSSSPPYNYNLAQRKARGLSASDNEQNHRTDSDQDNFSPTEDAEETDDGQLNCNWEFLIYWKIIIWKKFFFFFFQVSGPTPPGSPSSAQSQFGVFGIPSINGWLFNYNAFT